MARVKGAMMTRKHRNKILGLAKGYWGNKSRHYKMANQQMMKSGRYAYVGRKQKKRDFRQLWITRISAACKANGKLSMIYAGDAAGSARFFRQGFDCVACGMDSILLIQAAKQLKADVEALL